jgi:hypothetical protein
MPFVSSIKKNSHFSFRYFISYGNSVSKATVCTTGTIVRSWYSIFFNDSTAPWGPRPPHFPRLHDHTFRHTTFGRTPLDEGPARHRDLYLTTHNTHKGQTSMTPVGFEPTIPASERPQTHALDRTATGIGSGYSTRLQTLERLSDLSSTCGDTNAIRDAVLHNKSSILERMLRNIKAKKKIKMIYLCKLQRGPEQEKINLALYCFRKRGHFH